MAARQRVASPSIHVIEDDFRKTGGISAEVYESIIVAEANATRRMRAHQHAPPTEKRRSSWRNLRRPSSKVMVKQDSFRKVGGISGHSESIAPGLTTSTIDLDKSAGDTAGLYLRQGDGFDRLDGIFVHRLEMGSPAEALGLTVGDEILEINDVDVRHGDVAWAHSLMQLVNIVILKVCKRTIPDMTFLTGLDANSSPDFDSELADRRMLGLHDQGPFEQRVVTTQEAPVDDPGTSSQDSSMIKSTQNPEADSAILADFTPPELPAPSQYHPQQPKAVAAKKTEDSVEQELNMRTTINTIKNGQMVTEHSEEIRRNSTRGSKRSSSASKERRRSVSFDLPKVPWSAEKRRRSARSSSKQPSSRLSHRSHSHDPSSSRASTPRYESPTFDASGQGVASQLDLLLMAARNFQQPTLLEQGLEDVPTPTFSTSPTVASLRRAKHRASPDHMTYDTMMSPPPVSSQDPLTTFSSPAQPLTAELTHQTRLSPAIDVYQTHSNFTYNSQSGGLGTQDYSRSSVHSTFQVDPMPQAARQGLTTSGLLPQGRDRTPVQDTSSTSALLDQFSPRHEFYSPARSNLASPAQRSSILSIKRARGLSETRGPVYSTCLQLDQDQGLGLRVAGGVDTSLGALFIAYVVPGQTAELDGTIHEGDRLLSIDGTSTLQMKRDEVVKLLSTASSGPVTLRLMRIGLPQWTALQQEAGISTLALDSPPRDYQVNSTSQTDKLAEAEQERLAELEATRKELQAARVLAAEARVRELEALREAAALLSRTSEAQSFSPTKSPIISPATSPGISPTASPPLPVSLHHRRQGAHASPNPSPLGSPAAVRRQPRDTSRLSSWRRRSQSASPATVPIVRSRIATRTGSVSPSLRPTTTATPPDSPTSSPPALSVESPASSPFSNAQQSEVDTVRLRPRRIDALSSPLAQRRRKSISTLKELEKESKRSKEAEAAKAQANAQRDRATKSQAKLKQWVKEQNEGHTALAADARRQSLRAEAALAAEREKLRLEAEAERQAIQERSAARREAKAKAFEQEEDRRRREIDATLATTKGIQPPENEQLVRRGSISDRSSNLKSKFLTTEAPRPKRKLPTPPVKGKKLNK